MIIIPSSTRICIREMSSSERAWFKQNPTRRYHIAETMPEAVKRSLGHRGSDTVSLIRALSADYCAQISLPLRPNAETGELDDVVDALFDLGLVERLIGQSEVLVLEGRGSVQ